ncbi:hypothetical protein NPX13_g7703 [Xylaria arbuscula]|uniref:Uncharacterized protein n=1 Tax=Xylaria arbuscula TaxID=114810 RepID=A0A9W8NA39_9PEZI|nr:hypothetical protein NPX13_g7703 [Xylaria arbuscula]
MIAAPRRPPIAAAPTRTPVGLAAAAVGMEVSSVLEAVEFAPVAVGKGAVDIVPLDEAPGVAVGWQRRPVPVRRLFK